MTAAPSVTLVAVDVAWIVGSSVAVGAWAPRWPASWLARDRFPVRRWPGESAAMYRRLGVRRFARHLPEGGELFGGRSKSRMGGLSIEDLRRHLVEVRRAEWVHWLSIGLAALLFVFNPWPLALAFLLAVVAGNGPCLLALRNNRLRIAHAIAHRQGSR